MQVVALAALKIENSTHSKLFYLLCPLVCIKNKTNMPLEYSGVLTICWPNIRTYKLNSRGLPAYSKFPACGPQTFVSPVSISLLAVKGFRLLSVDIL